jgi:hypothetical protein
MSKRQNLAYQLTTAHQKLQNALTRVADLEAQLLQYKPTSTVTTATHNNPSTLSSRLHCSQSFDRTQNRVLTIRARIDSRLL